MVFVFSSLDFRIQSSFPTMCSSFITLKFIFKFFKTNFYFCLNCVQFLCLILVLSLQFKDLTVLFELYTVMCSVPLSYSCFVFTVQRPDSFV